jgi:WD40 repeat protein
LSGIVKERDGRLRERNRIYARAFDEDWIKAHMPDAELRRQKVAFRRGVFRATAIAALVVAALAVAVLFALNQAAQARKALARANFSQAKARRVSGVAGQRYESLKALGEARRDFTNETLLRDEALACLALMDLLETTNHIDRLEKSKLVELSPDLEVSAAADDHGVITIRRMRDGQLLTTLPGFDSPVEQLRLVPKTTYLIAEHKQDGANQVIASDWKSGQRLFALEQGIHGNAITVSRDKHRLALGVSNATILVLALPTGEKQGKLCPLRSTQLPRTPQAIEFDPSGKLLAVSSRDDQFVEIWDVDSRKVAQRFYHSDEVMDVSWHPQGRMLATACSDGTVYLWNTNDIRAPWKKLTGHEREILSVAFNHRGDLLASLGKDATVRLWIPATGRHLTVRLSEGDLNQLRFSDDDRFLIALGRGQKRVMVWSVQGDEYSILQSQARRFDEIDSIDFSPDGHLFAASSSDSIILWDVRTGRELGSLTFTNIYWAGFSANGERLLVSMDSGLFECPLVRNSDGEEAPLIGPRTRLTRLPKEVGHLAMSPGRTNAIVVHHTNAFAFAVNADAAPVLIPVGERFTKVAVHPAGSWIAGWAREKNLIQIFGLDSANAIRSRRSVPAGDCFAFSPDGEWLGLCATDGFHFYRVGQWNKIAFPLPRSSTATPHGPLAFSFDGRLLAVAFSPYDIRLYRFARSAAGDVKLLATLESPDRSPLQLLAFSPDGRSLAAATKNQIVQIWNLASLRAGLAALKLEGEWPEHH